MKHHVAGVHIEPGHDHPFLLLHHHTRFTSHHWIGEAINRALHQVLSMGRNHNGQHGHDRKRLEKWPKPQTFVDNSADHGERN